MRPRLRPCPAPRSPLSTPPKLRRAAALLALLALSCSRPAASRSAAERGVASKAAHATALQRPPAAAGAAAYPEGAVAEGTRGAVSSAEAHASDVGLDVLRRGGNAVDAAIAVAFALGVTHPAAGNIGGGGFMLVRLPSGETNAIDYREVAPGAARPDMFLDAAGKPLADRELGPRAAGIPGVVAGLGRAHELYGSRPWAELVAPAVALAEDGWQLDAIHAEELREVSASIDAYARRVPPSEAGLHAALRATLGTFRPPHGGEYREADVWRQPELGRTLRAIMERGPLALYRGALAETLATRVRAMGGIWTAADLEAYRAIERTPLRFTHRGHELVTMPPPSAGGVALLQILYASERLGLHDLAWDSTDRVHLFVEVLRRSFADRNERIADPGFVDVPVSELTSPEYLARRLRDIDPKRATPSARIQPGVSFAEAAETTHFSVVDGSGMAVANTYTLNGDFGAQVQIPGTGVTLNNEMDDFTAGVGAPNQFGLIQGPQNAIAGGKRMLSSMSPTIIAKDGRLRAVLGSPGGPTIITTVAQLALQLIDAGRSLPAAVAAPRVHHQWLPDAILHEPGLPPSTLAGLVERGHRLETEPSIGHANCIEVDPRTGVLRAVADVGRYGGKAVAF